jgi:predicted DNA-binding transcriptional regulator AlpA
MEDTTFLRLPEVRRRTGLSRSEIYRRAAKGPSSFPQPVRLGRRCTVFVASEVEAWTQARIASSRRSTP